MPRRKLLGIVAGLFVGIVALQFLLSPSRGSVRYHEEHLNYLSRPLSKAIYKDAPSQLDNKGRPVHLMDYLRFRTWRWYWKGGYTPTKLINEMEEHQQALIQLGYLECREFTLSNRSISAQFFAMITNAVPAKTIGLHLDDTKDRWIRITARKVDMPVVERTVAEFDSPIKN